MLEAEKNNQQEGHIKIYVKGIDMAKSRYDGHKISLRNDNRYCSTITLNGQKKFIYGKTQAECYQKLKEFVQQNKPQIKQKALTVN